MATEEFKAIASFTIRLRGACQLSPCPVRGGLLESIGRDEGDAVRVVTMDEYWNCEEEVKEVNFDPFDGRVPGWIQLHDAVNASGRITCRHQETREDIVGNDVKRWTTVRACWPPMFLMEAGKEMRIALCFVCTAEAKEVKLEIDRDEEFNKKIMEGLMREEEEMRTSGKCICRLCGADKDGEMVVCEQCGDDNC